MHICISNQTFTNNTENGKSKKIKILDNAFKLKNTIYNKIGISHEFDNIN